MPGGRKWVYVNGELVFEYPWKPYVDKEQPPSEEEGTAEGITEDKIVEKNKKKEVQNLDESGGDSTGQ